ncbi:MAG: DUF4349 domain-containing protein [Chloroflexota bacterium]
MKKMLIIGLMLVALLATSVACASAPKNAPVPSPTPAPAPMPAPAPAPSGIPAPTIIIGGKDSATSTSGGSLALAQERLIVRNGYLSLVVNDVITARDEITRIATGVDGYVVSSQIRGEGLETRGDIAIRVPDDQFEAVLTKLRQLAVRVSSESTDSQDITEEYIDLQARLSNAQATEQQYLALLDRATTVEDILKIYDNLSRVRSEIEQLKGRIKYLEQSSSTSLINAHLEPAATAGALVKPGWSALEKLKSAVRGIAAFGQWLGTVVIWLLVFSPVWGTIGALVWWFNRRRRKQKA